MNNINNSSPTNGQVDDEVSVLLAPLVRDWKTLVACSFTAGVLSLGATYLISPTFTARTSFLPPQQQGSSSNALASLGALAGLAGGGSSIKSPIDQYISLLESTTVSDRIIDHFKLMDAYEKKLRSSTRKQLADNVKILSGKKDGLIYIDVDDTDPYRAAEIANRYIEELRKMAGSLTLTEAQQRRAFFEAQLKQTRERLSAAQLSLQKSGFSAGDLRSEPRAAAEAYGRLKAEQTSAEIRLRTLLSSLAENAPEVLRTKASISELKNQIGKLELASTAQPNEQYGYVSKYRDYKYEESLFEVFARQYELAKTDESREGALIQVIDPAQPPDSKSKPRRAMTAIGGSLAGLFASMAFIIAFKRNKQKSPNLS